MPIDLIMLVQTDKVSQKQLYHLYDFPGTEVK